MLPRAQSHAAGPAFQPARTPGPCLSVHFQPMTGARACAPAAPQEADVFSFGVVLYELLTWEEPWRGVNSYQIMIALQDGGRPFLPPEEELPGQLGTLAAVAEYARLLQECWAE
jgi:hypothetical protein